ncbi:MAG TPA: NAD(P)-dependent oxidoreductase [Blastocatellia bacterium]|nr:NAD(P)-dependent oxidoreductase [Blastocatellia bacterium]
MKVGFIGLGQMGIGIARSLLRAGHELTVFNRTRRRAEELGGEGARVADSPAGAAAGVEVFVTMLADDAAVEQVIFGNNGAIAALPRGAVHVSMSTISVALSARLNEAHGAAGHGYVAAPVFGRPEAAAAAKLLVVASGAAAEIETCRPLLEAVGQRLVVIGEPATAANVVKITGNFLIAAVMEALGEAFALLKKSDVDAARFLDLMTSSLFAAPIYQNYGKLILAESFDPPGFKLTLGLKDVKLALAAAEAVAAPLPLASLVRDHMLAAVARGYSDLDWTAMTRVIAENAGIE